MLLDLIHWQIVKVARWNIEDLPVDVLVNFWLGIRDRELKKINYLNHSSALTVAATQTKEGKPIEIDRWLPFNLKDTKNESNPLPVGTIRLLKLLIDKGELEPRMIQDLYRNKIIDP